jgi:hypothetical protein
MKIQKTHFVSVIKIDVSVLYWGADKSLARPTFWFILFDVENISFDSSLVICTYMYIYTYKYY